MIEAIMRSDFIFDRNISNVPFIPLAYLTLNQQHNLEFSGGCVDIDCEFDYQSMSHGLAMPVWVGKKHMFFTYPDRHRKTMTHTLIIKFTVNINTAT